MEDNYLEINRETWNKKTEVHIGSEFYDQKGFLEGNNTLKQIELDLFGDVRNKKILHLQCHFGQDTMSLSRLGAKATGVDLSDKAIDKAREIAHQLNLDTLFINCDVYSLPEHLSEEFDIVFTSYGTIGWLPDLDKWAKVIQRFLKPGGKFIMVDFHPVVWMFDDNFEGIGYNYFKEDPIVEIVNGTYADKEAPISSKTISWNHATSETLNSLITNGLELNSFGEYDYSPYDCFSMTEEFEPGKYRIKHLGNKIPMVYSIVATKK
ncbi:ubiquinone/menaquinone biosynthesis C-methylase UbiE [Flavobacterium sp. 28YEA47A]|uniref:class I SAM-dependent methyltransferase n=1 Tax=Flavobacterium sp. 28YEA47A TaxID=3156276 RepID=UPI0035147577